MASRVSLKDGKAKLVNVHMNGKRRSNSLETDSIDILDVVQLDQLLSSPSTLNGEETPRLDSRNRSTDDCRFDFNSQSIGQDEYQLREFYHTFSCGFNPIHSSLGYFIIHCHSVYTLYSLFY